MTATVHMIHVNGTGSVEGTVGTIVHSGAPRIVGGWAEVSTSTGDHDDCTPDLPSFHVSGLIPMIGTVAEIYEGELYQSVMFAAPPGAPVRMHLWYIEP